MRLTVRGRHGRSLRDSVVPLLLPYQGRSIGAGFGTKLLCWLELLGEKLSTLAQDTRLSAPDRATASRDDSTPRGTTVVPADKAENLASLWRTLAGVVVNRTAAC